MMLSFLKQAFTPRVSHCVPSPRPVDRDDMVPWGTNWLPAKHNLHYALVGTTRSGKTTLLRRMMQHVLPDVRRGKNTRALVYDPKHEMHSILDGIGVSDHVITANPFDARCSAWAMYRDVRDDRICNEVAGSLVPRERTAKGDESFFTTTVRNLTTAVMTSFTRDSLPWTLRDVLLTLSDTRALTVLLNRYADTANTLHHSLEQRDQTAQDIHSSIGNLVNRLGTIAALWHRAEKERPPFSITEWTDQDRILILPGPRSDGDPVMVLNEILFNRTAAQLLARREALAAATPPRTWMFIDELRQAGELRLLKNLLTGSASKGVRVVIGLQGIEGLHDAYGQNVAEELLSLCANKALLCAGGDVTAEWMSRQIHHQFEFEEEVTVSWSNGQKSTSSVTRKVDRPVVPSISFLELNTVETNDELEGFFVAPSLRREGRGVFYSSLSRDQLYGSGGLIRPKGAAPDFIPRPSEQQIIPPWDAGDLRRLRLPTHLSNAARSASRFLSISRSQLGLES